MDDHIEDANPQISSDQLLQNDISHCGRPPENIVVDTKDDNKNKDVLPSSDDNSTNIITHSKKELQPSDISHKIESNDNNLTIRGEVFDPTNSRRSDISYAKRESFDYVDRRASNDDQTFTEMTIPRQYQTSKLEIGKPFSGIGGHKKSVLWTDFENIGPLNDFSKFHENQKVQNTGKILPIAEMNLAPRRSSSFPSARQSSLLDNSQGADNSTDSARRLMLRNVEDDNYEPPSSDSDESSSETLETLPDELKAHFQIGQEERKSSISIHPKVANVAFQIRHSFLANLKSAKTQVDVVKRDKYVMIVGAKLLNALKITKMTNALKKQFLQDGDENCPKKQKDQSEFDFLFKNENDKPKLKKLKSEIPDTQKNKWSAVRDVDIKWCISDVFCSNGGSNLGEEDFIENDTLPFILRANEGPAIMLRMIEQVVSAITIAYAWLIWGFQPIFNQNTGWFPGTPSFDGFQIFYYVCELIYYAIFFCFMFVTKLNSLEKEEILDPKYLKKLFFTDPFNYPDILMIPIHALNYILDRDVHFTTIGLMLAVGKLNRIRWFAQSDFDKFLNLASFYDVIIKLFLVLMLMGHITGCLWFYVMRTQTYQPSKLLNERGVYQHFQLDGAITFHPDGFPVRPILLSYSFAFKTGLYICLGIDVEGASAPENLFLTIATPLGACISALVISNVLVLVSRASSLVDTQEITLQQIRSTMQDLDLPSSLRLRILAYQAYTNWNPVDSVNMLMPNLSPQLLYEVHLLIYFSLLRNVPIFRKSPEVVLREFVKLLRDVAYLPGDFICRCGDQAEEMYFIKRGLCFIMTNDWIPTKRLVVGEYFGEVGLLSSRPFSVFLVSQEYSILSVLAKVDFDIMMKKFPDQLQYFMEKITEADKIMIESEKEKLGASPTKRGFFREQQAAKTRSLGEDPKKKEKSEKQKENLAKKKLKHPKSLLQSQREINQTEKNTDVPVPTIPPSEDGGDNSRSSVKIMNEKIERKLDTDSDTINAVNTKKSSILEVQEKDDYKRNNNTVVDLTGNISKKGSVEISVPLKERPTDRATIFGKRRRTDKSNIVPKINITGCPQEAEAESRKVSIRRTITRTGPSIISEQAFLRRELNRAASLNVNTTQPEKKESSDILDKKNLVTVSVEQFLEHLIDQKKIHLQDLKRQTATQYESISRLDFIYRAIDLEYPELESINEEISNLGQDIEEFASIVFEECTIIKAEK